ENEKEKQEKDKEKKRTDQIQYRKNKSEQEIDNILTFVAQKEEEESEITESDWIEIKKILEVEEKGSEEQKKEIRQQKITICMKIIYAFNGFNGEEQKKKAIEAGIADVFIHLFSTHPFESIVPTYAWTFFTLSYNINDELKMIITSKKPFAALFRQFDNPRIVVVDKVVASVYNIISIGQSSPPPDEEQHTHYQYFSEHGGIERLFALFKKKSSKISQSKAALCICLLFRGKEIINDPMRQELIVHIKTLVTDSKGFDIPAKVVLRGPAKNTVNRIEIQQDDFKIPND
ncbi:MAG: hypothetical protein EZS28_013688, partial [Streblomastix strix]